MNKVVWLRVREMEKEITDLRGRDKERLELLIAKDEEIACLRKALSDVEARVYKRK